MSTPFLDAFALGLVVRLVEQEQLLIEPGRTNAVIAFVASDLAAPKEGRSLISTVSNALICCPDVIDLFADNDAIGKVITDMGAVSG